MGAPYGLARYGLEGYRMRRIPPSTGRYSDYLWVGAGRPFFARGGGFAPFWFLSFFNATDYRE